MMLSDIVKKTYHAGIRTLIASGTENGEDFLICAHCAVKVFGRAWENVLAKM